MSGKCYFLFEFTNSHFVKLVVFNLSDMLLHTTI
nr:MAG TPA: hypothetical protein [Caudoviricetes sp.]